MRNSAIEGTDVADIVLLLDLTSSSFTLESVKSPLIASSSSF